MKRYCTNLDCSEHSTHLIEGPKSGRIVKKGLFYRRSDRRYIQRFKCLVCGIQFSQATLDPNYRQSRRDINSFVYRMLCSGVSQRRTARLLQVSRRTINRKFSYLASHAKLDHTEWLDERYRNEPIKHIHFDDLETSEHTKCKPLSVSLAVHAKTREILGFQVKKMPAKGLLAKVSRQKYGFRMDERPLGWDQMFNSLKGLVDDQAVFESDENPHYPKFLNRHFPRAKHLRHKGARGAIVGQGELKKLHYDPLFSLNHTCAMLRANLNRLFRRTWCTTKKVEGLIDHLWLYVRYHNTELINQKY